MSKKRRFRVVVPNPGTVIVDVEAHSHYEANGIVGDILREILNNPAEGRDYLPTEFIQMIPVKVGVSNE